jgi:hypothetical protein
MKCPKASIVMGAALCAVIVIRPVSALSATVLPKDNPSQIVAIQNTKIENGAVSGELVNKSNRTVRDVQLSIRHIWQWNDEFHPKEDSLSTTVLYAIKSEIAPGGSVSFTYRPPVPLPSRPDGYFETTVSVAGFTEVVW